MKKYQNIYAILLAMILVACGGSSSSANTNDSSIDSSTTSSSSSSSLAPLTSITITGAEDTDVIYESMFNVLTNVKAMGNNGLDFSEFLTFATTSNAINRTTGDMDTTQLGLHAVRYTINYEGILVQKWRYLTVPLPDLPRVGMVINGNFQYGLIGWNNPEVVFTGSGQLTLDIDEGALRAVVTTGNDAWTPRFGQMNVPFEINKSYQVSFKAKSSVTKTIGVNIGELLPNDPFFVDFKPRQDHSFIIQPTWDTYTFKFTMRLDNPRGGILFHLGKINGDITDATLWFDDIFIEETAPDLDTVGPELYGVETTQFIPLNSTYNPLVGVSAFDIYESKDYSDSIVVTIKNTMEQTVLAVDTSLEATYTIIYEVSDASSNKTTVQATLNVIDPVIQGTNIIFNPTFNEVIVEDQWRLIAPGVFGGIATGFHDLESANYQVSISEGGTVPYSIQFNQSNIFSVEQGKTYMINFRARSSVARAISLAMGVGEPWLQYFRRNSIPLTTSYETFTFIFTVQQETALMKLTFELGEQLGFAPSTIFFDSVNMYEIILP
jgi:hypothetical protein